MSLRDLALGTNYGLTLNRLDPVRLRSETPVIISLALYFQILDVEDNHRLIAVTTRYFYTLAVPNGDEILAFHWNPDASTEKAERSPHLHVGPAVSRSSQIRPGTVHKVHVPTGYVSMQSVIRLAITEFGVTPRRPDWESVLAEPEANPTP